MASFPWSFQLFYYLLEIFFLNRTLFTTPNPENYLNSPSLSYSLSFSLLLSSIHFVMFYQISCINIFHSQHCGDLKSLCRKCPWSLVYVVMRRSAIVHRCGFEQLLVRWGEGGQLDFRLWKTQRGSQSQPSLVTRFKEIEWDWEFLKMYFCVLFHRFQTYSRHRAMWLMWEGAALLHADAENSWLFPPEVLPSSTWGLHGCCGRGRDHRAGFRAGLEAVLSLPGKTRSHCTYLIAKKEGAIILCAQEKFERFYVHISLS